MRPRYRTYVDVSQETGERLAAHRRRVNEAGCSFSLRAFVESAITLALDAVEPPPPCARCGALVTDPTDHLCLPAAGS